MPLRIETDTVALGDLAQGDVFMTRSLEDSPRMVLGLKAGWLSRTMAPIGEWVYSVHLRTGDVAAYRRDTQVEQCAYARLTLRPSLWFRIATWLRRRRHAA